MSDMNHQILYNHLIPLFTGTVSAVAWACVYFILKQFMKDRSPEFVNRLITIIHGSLVTIGGSKQCFVDGWVYSLEDHATSKQQELILRISLGYFLFDLVWCLYYKTETNLMIGHHIYSIIALYRLLGKDFNGGPATCALGGMEATNPLLQMRWFIRTFKYQKTWIFTVVEWTFVVSFVFLRIFVGSVIMMYILFGKGRDLEFKILAIIIYLVSWAFVMNIVKFVGKKYLRAEVGEERETRSSIVTDDGNVTRPV